MKLILIFGRCAASLLLLLFPCCSSPDPPTYLRLGQLVGNSPEGTFEVNAPNNKGYNAWELRLQCAANEKDQYLHTDVVITVENTDTSPIKTLQDMLQDVNNSQESGENVIQPNESKVLYRGTLAGYLGMEGRVAGAHLSFPQDGHKNLKCRLTVRLANSELLQPVEVGLNRYWSAP
ncbi:MAG TPA: hypothetical protein VG733_05060 [Chthoniobacteraceae bacterium]|nr:hypothetical protein [Chthoniobacteraceae bacterium]